MQIEYDRDSCIGMFQCVAEWDAFERDEGAGKAVLVDGEEADLLTTHGDAEPGTKVL